MKTFKQFNEMARMKEPDALSAASGTKVVDEKGKPLLLYHGTNAEKFDTFDASKIQKRDSGFFGVGFYFTPDISIADEFAIGSDGEEGYVIEVYVKLNNPFIFDLRSEETFQNTVNDLYKLGFKELRATPNFFTFNLVGDEPRKFNQYAKQSGYDGSIVLRDNGVDDHQIDEVIAFEPNQIFILDEQ